MQSAKLARQRREIRRVRAALRWAEHHKSLRADFYKRRSDNKRYVVESLSYKREFLLSNVKQARLNRIEDWRLGPLRPERAIGEGAGRYGTISGQQTRPISLPEHVLKDEVWPIQENDRVLIIKGREKNKIGIIKEVGKENRTVTIKDTNMVWVDGRAYSAGNGGQKPDKQAMELPIPLEDVRLIATRPQQVPDPNDVDTTIEVDTDFLVEAIELRKHTSGVDPWDNQYKVSIPEEHQVYPENGETIYKRYIAGTDEPIQWPWEAKGKIGEGGEAEKNEKRVLEGDGDEKTMGRTRRVKQKVQDVASSVWNRVTGKRPTPNSKQETEDTTLPQYKVPVPITPAEAYHYNDNTVLAEVSHASYVPGLLIPPFPDGVIDELRDKWTGKPIIEGLWSEKYEKLAKEHGRRGIVAALAEKRRNSSTDRQADISSNIRTPLQVRRELAHASRQSFRETETPQISKDVLMAIGAAMRQNGIRKPNRTSFVVEDGQAFEVAKDEKSVLVFPKSKQDPRRIKDAKSKMRKEKRLLDLY